MECMWFGMCVLRMFDVVVWYLNFLWVVDEVGLMLVVVSY